jgi:hypothetical protein
MGRRYAAVHATPVPTSFLVDRYLLFRHHHSNFQGAARIIRRSCGRKKALLCVEFSSCCSTETRVVCSKNNLLLAQCRRHARTVPPAPDSSHPRRQVGTSQVVVRIAGPFPGVPALNLYLTTPVPHATLSFPIPTTSSAQIEAPGPSSPYADGLLVGSA